MALKNKAVSDVINSQKMKKVSVETQNKTFCHNSKEKHFKFN